MIAVACSLDASSISAADAAHLAATKDAVLARIRSGEPAAHEKILRDDAWQSVHPQIHVKVLRNDGAILSWLLRLLPDTGLPAHTHDDGDEECMVLEGSVRLDGVWFHAGDYTLAVRGSAHRDVYSATGCVLFLKSPATLARRLRLLAPA